jgi:hypothetical protein
MGLFKSISQKLDRRQSPEEAEGSDGPADTTSVFVLLPGHGLS